MREDLWQSLHTWQLVTPPPSCFMATVNCQCLNLDQKCHLKLMGISFYHFTRSKKKTKTEGVILS